MKNFFKRLKVKIEFNPYTGKFNLFTRQSCFDFWVKVHAHVETVIGPSVFITHPLLEFNTITEAEKYIVQKGLDS